MSRTAQFGEASLAVSTSTVRDVDKDENLRAHVRITPPVGPGNSDTPSGRQNVAVVIVLDTSGSMNTQAEIKGTDAETSGVSIIDLARNALQTVVSLLGAQDKFALVTFSDFAKVEIPFLSMDDQGQAKAKSVVEKIQAMGRTNLWGGMLKALNAFEEIDPSLRQAMIVMTDGEPNISPPKGELQALNALLASKPDRMQTICHTFGFGPQVNSDLLEKIATIGSGTYGYINDPSVLATAITCVMPNTMTTCAIRLKARISVTGDKGEIKHIMGLPETRHEDNETGAMTVTVEMGNLQYGQPRDFVVLVKPDHDAGISELDVSVTLTAQGWEPATVRTLADEALELPSDDELKAAAWSEFRQGCIDVMQKAWEAAKAEKSDAPEMVKQGVHELRNKLELAVPDLAHTADEGLLKDMNEAVLGTELTSFGRWGKHFVPSLWRAHSAQQCINFKNEGLQAYGGTMFKSLQDQANDLFNAIEMIIPEPPQIQRFGSSPALGHMRNGPAMPSAGPRTISMRLFNNSSNPCFSGDCYMRRAYDQTKVPLNALKAGDSVVTADGSPDTIQCILVTTIKDGCTLLCHGPNQLKVTPWHPICLRELSNTQKNGWCFPAEHLPHSLESCNAVYSFLMQNRGLLLVNDIQAASLAHGITNNAVLKHSFFGTEAVVNSLARLPGFDQGIVQLNQNCLIRDQHTGLVTDFRADGNNDTTLSVVPYINCELECVA